MNGFEAFGIERVSPSELKTFASEDAGMWFAKYRKNLWDDAGPAAWRGDAVEGGLNAFAYGRGAPGQIAEGIFQTRYEEYLEKNQGVLSEQVDEKLEEERAKVAICLERAIAAWEAEGLKAIGEPTSKQLWCQAWFKDAPVQVGGKFDWRFLRPENKSFTIDLKTTNSIPSQPKEEGKKPEPSPDHAIQATVYARAQNDCEARILYVSAKEYKTKPKAGEERRVHCMITLDAADLDRYERLAVETLKKMEAMLISAVARSEYECISKEDALAELCRPNLLAQGGGMYPIWKSDFTKRAFDEIGAWN